jgi:hypothetical protein
VKYERFDRRLLISQTAAARGANFCFAYVS